nr:hypothetical protein [Tanacetum cinerariifolium]
ATRHARRIYFGELYQFVATHFSHVMSAIGGNTASREVCLCGMRSVEEASNAMALDGIIFDGALVKVRRPSDYNPLLVATLGPSQPNPNLNLGAVGLTPGGLEGPDRIFDLSVTDIACAALNGIKMGDRTLTVRRANQGQTQLKRGVYCYIHNYKLRCRLMLQPVPIGPPPTKVLSLMQVIQATALQTLTGVIRDSNAKSKTFITLFIGELLNDIFWIIKQQPFKREAITVTEDCLKILMLLHTSSKVAESQKSLMSLLLEALSWFYQLQRMIPIRTLKKEGESCCEKASKEGQKKSSSCK